MWGQEPKLINAVILVEEKVQRDGATKVWWQEKGVCATKVWWHKLDHEVVVAQEFNEIKVRERKVYVPRRCGGRTIMRILMKS